MAVFSTADSITQVKGVGPALANKLARLNISTIGDLFNHLPSRYLDFTKQVRIKDLTDKETASFLATVTGVKTFFTRSGKLITQAHASDPTGRITLTWFNNPYIKRLLKDGERHSIAGKPSLFGGHLTIISPVLEIGDSFSLNTRGLVPVYNLTEGITSKWLRKKIFELLSDTEITDPLPRELLEKNKLSGFAAAVRQIHFPKNTAERWSADRRLAYNQHLRINITNKLEQDKLGSSIKIKPDRQVNKVTAKKLPFNLTESQLNTISQIEKDLSRTDFTHRLIQGETGSGKTAPLLFAAAHCLNAGYSCAILAPTEILATQHISTFQKYFLFPQNIRLVTADKPYHGSTKPMVYIGTTALLNQLPERLEPPLAFIAIDEQHRFGVTQREALLKRVPIPHLFNLSATPIPRTVALGLLGDIRISTVAAKPGRQIKTYVVTPSKFRDSPKWLINQLQEENQIFVVCPSIKEQSQNSSVETVSKIYRKLIPEVFPIFTVHGRMSRDDQNETLNRFKSTPGSVLVSTSLIEVGIDIPTANIMIIHSAERFGLAQLHQLRGRVGRGREQGHCFLVPSIDDDVENDRLKLLQKFHNGLILSKKDLRLRGAGDIYGQKQHGIVQTRLKYFWSKKLFTGAKSDALDLVRNNHVKAKEIAGNLISW